jgi:CRISPR-associated protein Cas5d
MTRSRTFRVHVSGPLAVFTRPERSAERASYEVMTPSAARGVLEAVVWKPAMRWVVESIAVLRDIRWTLSRGTAALRDVAYVIDAHLCLTERAGPEETIGKFEAIFERRLTRGQAHHQPYLGCRELAADLRPADRSAAPIPLSKSLGLLLWDFDYAAQPRRPLYFDARLDHGVLRVPTEEEVRRHEAGRRQ